MTFDRKAYMREYQKKWYQDNKDRLKQKFKSNHSENLDRDRQRSREWYYENRELTLARVKARSDNPTYKTKKREVFLKGAYGLSLEDYQNMFEHQKGRCAICQTHQEVLSKRLEVDHNHITGKVRKLLCGKCNKAIGLLQDNPILALRVVEYLNDN